MCIGQYLMFDTNTCQCIGVKVVQPADERTAPAAGIRQTFAIGTEYDPVVNSRRCRVQRARRRQQTSNGGSDDQSAVPSSNDTHRMCPSVGVTMVELVANGSAVPAL